MKFIKFTYVDCLTGVSVAYAPAANGPIFPNIPGLEFAWARESLYPTAVPQFFGICPDESDTAVEGFLGEFSQVDWENMHSDELLARRPPIPQEVTMAQCRLALFDQHGIPIENDEEFYALADILPEADRARARFELRTRGTVRYDNPLVIAFCEAMGWDRDALFIYGDAQ